MLRPLVRHPDSEAPSVQSLAASIQRLGGGGLSLRYVLSGDLDLIRTPPPVMPVRSAGLWRTTCFEAFVAGEGGSYIELNFSPSGEWAAYRFAGYRSGMRDIDAGSPRIAVRTWRDRLELRVEAQLPPGNWTQAGLSAIIEERSGGKSYWALAHPSGAPDFHHPHCFALDLPPPPSA